MLLACVSIFISFMIALGYLSSRRVQTSADFVSAARSLHTWQLTPIIVCSWIGGSSLLGGPATFVQQGFSGIPGDPLGSSLCLCLVALFFGQSIYRKKVRTLGEYFRNRYSPKAEQLLSFVIVLSYLGWAISVLHATEITLELLTNRSLTHTSAIVISSITIVLYTIFGGMWSVAWTNYIITTLILVGLTSVFCIAAGSVGGPATLVHLAVRNNQFTLFPDHSWHTIMEQTTSIAIMAIGLLPQQDLLQRVNSARNERTLRISHFLGGIIYFLISLIPLLTAYAITLAHPLFVHHWIEKAPQFILPLYVMNKSSFIINVLFFGSLFSGLLTSGSTSIFAPSVAIVENFIKPFKTITDKQTLLLSRLSIIVVTTIIAIVTLTSSRSIYQQVLDAYSITFVLASVPLLSGLYWKKANNTGVLTSLVLGILFWITASQIKQNLFPVPLIGFGGSLLGMLLGSHIRNTRS